MNINNEKFDDGNQLPPLLTVEEVAKILRIGKVKAYEFVRTPGFPTIKIGRAVRIPTKLFFSWLHSNSVA